MPIKFSTGDMFAKHFDIRINPVNCVGVMGKGLALEFRKRYPVMFEEYKRDCFEKLISIGTVWEWVWCGSWIINFPTKRDWRDKSLLKDISSGLASLRSRLLRVAVSTTVAIPALGCGEGGLAWRDVKPLIEAKLGDLPMSITVFAPLGVSV